MPVGRSMDNFCALRTVLNRIRNSLNISESGMVQSNFKSDLKYAAGSSHLCINANIIINIHYNSIFSQFY